MGVLLCPAARAAAYNIVTETLAQQNNRSARLKSATLHPSWPHRTARRAFSLAFFITQRDAIWGDQNEVFRRWWDEPTYHVGERTA